MPALISRAFPRAASLSLAAGLLAGMACLPASAHTGIPAHRPQAALAFAGGAQHPTAKAGKKAAAHSGAPGSNPVAGAPDLPGPAKASATALDSPESNTGVAVGSDAGAQPTSWPMSMLHVVGVLLWGMLVNAARLARKFRHYWGQGVLTNPYAFLFSCFGGIVSGLPMVSENFFKTIHPLQAASPWIATALGLAAGLFLPGLRVGGKKAAAAAGAGETPGGNPVLDVIEEKIRELIRKRMRRTFSEMSKHYDRRSIKQAARRTLAEDRGLNRLADKDASDAEKFINGIPENEVADSPEGDPYDILWDLQKWLDYGSLRQNLEMGRQGARP